MITLDIFNQDAFSAISLTNAVEKFEYVPNYLGSLTAAGRPLFTPEPVTTTFVGIEQLDNALSLVPISQRGTPPTQRGKEKRKIRNFETVRFAPSDTIRADELQNVRAFGEVTELQAVQSIIAHRQMKLRQDLETTMEYVRLGAVQGLMLDPKDGSTVINYFTEFGISQPAEIDFDLDNASPATGAIRKKCALVRRKTERALGSLAIPGMKIMALCGDAFWDDLISHPEVEKTYLNYEAAAQLREDQTWSEFTYGGINFSNYRGTDDNSKVAVGVDKVKFFPAGVPGMFQMAQAPAETFEFVNTPGKEVYSFVKPDLKNNTHADIELYSYPLAVCSRPGALQRGKRT